MASVSSRLLVLALSLLGLGCAPSWDWFLTPDQQGRLWLERGDPIRAARSFEDPLRKGLAYYEAGDWASAAGALAPLESVEGRFQYANALARLERLPEAIDAYESVLAQSPELPEAVFNLDWVRSLYEQDQKEYEDAGGTGGKLGADKIVFDERGSKGKGEMTRQDARAAGLSDEQMREMWMRRVETTPADFLRLKFSYQAQAGARSANDGEAAP